MPQHCLSISCNDIMPRRVIIGARRLVCLRINAISYAMRTTLLIDAYAYTIIGLRLPTSIYALRHSRYYSSLFIIIRLIAFIVIIMPLSIIITNRVSCRPLSLWSISLSFHCRFQVSPCHAMFSFGLLVILFAVCFIIISVNGFSSSFGHHATPASLAFAQNAYRLIIIHRHISGLVYYWPVTPVRVARQNVSMRRHY